MYAPLHANLREALNFYLQHAKLQGSCVVFDGAAGQLSESSIKRLTVIATEVRAMGFPAHDDVLTMGDFALAVAALGSEQGSFWNGSGQGLATDLLCLLQSCDDEELLPPEGSKGLGIWKIFAGAEKQLKQLIAVATYVGNYLKLPKSHSILQAMRSTLDSTMTAFQEAEAHLAGKMAVNLGLKVRLNHFTIRLGVLWQKIKEYADSKKCPLFEQRNCMLNRLRYLRSEASEIAAEVEKLQPLSPGSSWEMISESPSDQLGSAASCHSFDSEKSYLSAKGGPHCFLPSYLFKQVGDAFPSTSLVCAEDLQKGAKILSVDGDPLEVIKVKLENTKMLIDLEIDDAVPFTTTPQHRIMVPAKNDDATVKAMDLEAGDWVMCSGREAKRLMGKRVYVVENQQVLAITFHPDKAVACYLPPEEPVLLTKGRTPKPIHRGGMNRRGAKQEVVSIPDTAPGEYED